MNIASPHKNNFDFLRLAFASFVIISHSSALSGMEYHNFLPEINTTLSTIGVFGFFIISGYLISGSLERTNNAMLFLRKRLLRIFPGLIAVSFLSTFILGGFLTTLGKFDYYSNTGTYLHFLATIFLIPVYKCLPGVFTNNPTFCAVNGSLWTLRYELLFYGVLGLFCFIKPQWRKSVSIGIAIALLVCTYVWQYVFEQKAAPGGESHLGRMLDLAFYFFSGVLLNYVPIITAKNRKTIFFISFPLGLACLYAPHAFFFFPLVFPLLVISSALFYSPLLQISPKIGDISYGTYIYGYPVQQSLQQVFAMSNLYLFLIISLFTSYLMGFISWQLVEKRFIVRKKVANHYDEELKHLSPSEMNPAR